MLHLPDSVPGSISLVRVEVLSLPNTFLTVRYIYQCHQSIPLSGGDTFTRQCSGNTDFCDLSSETSINASHVPLY